MSDIDPTEKKVLDILTKIKESAKEIEELESETTTILNKMEKPEFKIEEFRKSEIEKLGKLMTQYQLISLLNSKIDDMRKAFSTRLLSIWNKIRCVQLNKNKLIIVGDSESLEAKEVKHLLERLSNDAYVVLQLNNEAWQKVMPQISKEDYRIYNIKLADYVKVKKGFSSFREVKESKIEFDDSKSDKPKEDAIKVEEKPKEEKPKEEKPKESSKDENVIVKVKTSKKKNLDFTLKKP